MSSCIITTQGLVETPVENVLICRIFCDFNKINNDQDANFHDISLSNLWAIKNNPYLSCSNLRLCNVDEQLSELKRIILPSIILDMTTVNEKRNLEALANLSENIDNQLICFTASPVDSNLTVAELTMGIVNELLIGVDIGPIRYCKESVVLRAGAISCSILSINDPLTPSENIQLGACASVHADAKMLAPIFLETVANSTVHSTAISLLSMAGADMSRVVFCGVIFSYKNLPYLTNLLLISTCKFCVDGFGNVQCSNTGGQCLPPNDDEIIDVLHQLCALGYLNRFIISIAIKYKIHLRRYGGPGYNHINESVRLRLHEKGFQESEINKLCCHNASSILYWYTPPLPVEAKITMIICYYCKKEFEPKDYFEKFNNVYCSTKCLSAHRKLGWNNLNV